MENQIKINYYVQSLEEIEEFKKQGIKPTIAVHACCGPCAAFPIEFLDQYFSRIVILYDNSNIYPSEEYERRMHELERYIQEYNEEHHAHIELKEFDYDNSSYNQMLDKFGDQEEGLERCQFCYRYRMNECYRYANDNHFDFFTTVMTISRQKSSQIMNQIGLDLSKHYTTKYFFSDFKKNKGQDRARTLRLQHHLYSQQYCGCIYSYHRYLKKAQEKEKLEK